jgi:hypothetical protein
VSDNSLCLSVFIATLVFNALVVWFLWATGLLESKNTIKRAKAAWDLYKKARVWDEKLAAAALGAVILVTSGARTISAVIVAGVNYVALGICRTTPSRSH